MIAPDVQFDRAFYTAGLVSKVPFDNTQADFISSLQAAKKILGVGEIEANPKKNRLDLLDHYPKTQSRRFELSIIEERSILFGMEKGFESEERLELYQRVFGAVLEHVSVIPAALEFLDKRVRLDKKTLINPELAFARIARGSSLFEVITGRRLYTFRPDVTFAISEDGARVCRLEFRSNIPASEVDAGRSETPNTAQIHCSVGQTAALGSISDVTEAIVMHVKSVREFVSNEIIPKILQPFLQEIAERAGLFSSRKGL